MFPKNVGVALFFSKLLLQSVSMDSGVIVTQICRGHTVPPWMPSAPGQNTTTALSHITRDSFWRSDKELASTNPTQDRVIHWGAEIWTDRLTGQAAAWGWGCTSLWGERVTLQQHPEQQQHRMGTRCA